MPAPAPRAPRRRAAPGRPAAPARGDRLLGAGRLLAALLLAGLAGGCGEPPAPDPASPAGLGRAYQEATGRELPTGLREAADGAARARALAQRPLTSADVERFVALRPRVQEVAGDAKALEERLQEAGLTRLEWAALARRILAAVQALGLPPEQRTTEPGSTLAADIAAVQPHLGRLGALPAPR